MDAWDGHELACIQYRERISLDKPWGDWSAPTPKASEAAAIAFVESRRENAAVQAGLEEWRAIRVHQTTIACTTDQPARPPWEPPTDPQSNPARRF